MEMLKVLVIEPEKKPYTKEIPHTLESMQKEVGGYIQAVYPWDDPCAIICDEEGKLKGYPYNRVLRDEDGDIYDVIAGTFLVVGLGREDFVSLSDEYIEKYSKLFAAPVLFFQTKDKLLVVPVSD